MSLSSATLYVRSEGEVWNHLFLFQPKSGLRPFVSRPDWLSKIGTLYVVLVSNSPESYFNLYLYGKFGIDKILRKFISLSK